MDKKAVLALMTECYENHVTDKKAIEELKNMPIMGAPQAGSQSYLATAKSFAIAGGSFLSGVMVCIAFFSLKACAYIRLFESC